MPSDELPASLRLPERDLERWHLSPDTRQFDMVMAGDVRTKVVSPRCVPAYCPVHPFRRNIECFWSMTAGPGYPRSNLSKFHWWKMGRLNKRVGRIVGN